MRQFTKHLCKKGSNEQETIFISPLAHITLVAIHRHVNVDFYADSVSNRTSYIRA